MTKTQYLKDNMSTWNDKPNDAQHEQDWRNRVFEETKERCARVALREDIPLGRLEIYKAIRALKEKP